MSCEECDRIQELNKKGKDLAYLRINSSNVLIGACDKHFNMLKQQLGHNIELHHIVHRVK